MPVKPRRKKSAARATKPVQRTRRAAKPAPVLENVDPVTALREHRTCLEAMLTEVRGLHETTFREVRALVETTTTAARALSAFINEEITKIEAGQPTLPEQRHCASGTEHDEDTALAGERE
jgi:hypothetical protein